MSKVLVNFIQDRSGSMQSVWAETLNGFKSFVNDLKANGAKDGAEYLFSLTIFDTQVETPIIGASIDGVHDDALAKHGPRGSTALYDAVGATIKNTEDNPQGADKIIVVVVTDGQENSSREWSKDKLQSAIEAKLNLGNWTFTYLGTQPETWADAQAIGIASTSSATYTPNMASAAYSATVGAVRAMASSSCMGTRSLMQDYMPSATAARAGMKTRSSGPTPKPKPFPMTPTKQSDKSSQRWR